MRLPFATYLFEHTTFLLNFLSLKPLGYRSPCRSAMSEHVQASPGPPREAIGVLGNYPIGIYREAEFNFEENQQER